ncbi:MAG TPA: hypothetical protein VF797_01505, partial [Noviherbaspirillum sp.]
MSGQRKQAGPVRAVHFPGSSDIEDEAGHPLAIGLFADDATRLAACWNALGAFPTEDIERSAVDLTKLKQERDSAFSLLRELLAD